MLSHKHSHQSRGTTKPALHPWNSPRLRLVSSCSGAVRLNGNIRIVDDSGFRARLFWKMGKNAESGHFYSMYCIEQRRL